MSADAEKFLGLWRESSASAGGRSDFQFVWENRPAFFASLH
jgi:hypothetical protein